MNVDQHISWAEEQGALFLLNCSCSTTFLAYDICLTLDDEAEFIWPQSWWNLSKWVYLVLRYFSLFVLISLWFAGTQIGVDIGFSRPFDCIGWYKYEVASLQIVVLLMESILMLRVYALYERSKKIAALLLVTFAIEQGVMAWSMSVVIPRTAFSENCVSTSVPGSSVWFGIAPILFELMLLILTVCKVIKRGRNSSAYSPLLRVLIRDGVWCFWAVLVTFALNGIFYLAISGPKNSFAWGWQYAISAFSGCRLILHMHADTSTKGVHLAPSSTTAYPDGTIPEQYALDSLMPDLLVGVDTELGRAGAITRPSTMYHQGHLGI